jgi:hypothetical protein
MLWLAIMRRDKPCTEEKAYFQIKLNVFDCDYGLPRISHYRYVAPSHLNPPGNYT